jgi:hypothetical protein
MNALTIITNALHIAGILDPDETPSNAEAETVRLRLNLMLDQWSIKRLLVYVRSEDTKVLTIGDGDYTIGEDGTPDIDTIRPVKIEEAFLRDSSSNDFPLDCVTMTQREYNNIPLKTVSGIPSRLFYKNTVPNGIIYFDVLPNAAYTLYAYSWKALTAFADLTTEYNFPPGYESAITANLSVRAANDNRQPITELMAKEALDTLNDIKNVNVEVPLLRSSGSAPGVSRAFNFWTGGQ